MRIYTIAEATALLGRPPIRSGIALPAPGSALPLIPVQNLKGLFIVDKAYTHDTDYFNPSVCFEIAEYEQQQKTDL